MTQLILLILSGVSFAIAAFVGPTVYRAASNEPYPIFQRINFVGLGLLFWVIVAIINYSHTLIH